MTDTQRLNWLQREQMSLINDDFGHWAVTQDGMQNRPDKTPADIATSFFIEKSNWHTTIRKAIDAAITAAKEKP